MKNQNVLHVTGLNAGVGRPIQLTLPFECELRFQRAIRPIHYLGSKLRFVDSIRSTIDAVDPSGGYVCDLFAGSGTVSKYLSYTRPVISVDIQEYARVICSALLNPPRELCQFGDLAETCAKSEHSKKLRSALASLIDYENMCIRRALEGDPVSLCELIENGSIVSFERGLGKRCSPQFHEILEKVSSRLAELNLLDGPEALIVRYYGGVYFSYEQALQLDVLLEFTARAPKEIRDTLLASILSTASEIVNTLGKQFAQPIRPRKADGTPKEYIGERVQRDRSIDVLSTFQRWLELYVTQPRTEHMHKVYKLDFLHALDLIDDDVKVVYADPPYTRDHYSRFYHVLETICLRDNPQVSMTCVEGRRSLSRGIYRKDRYQSPFCIKSKAIPAFEGLFQKVRGLGSSLVLSYSPFDKGKKARPRLITLDKLENIAKKYYPKVSVASIANSSHSKLNRSDKNADISYSAEVLIVCEPK